MADTIPTTFTVPLVEYTRLATERDALAARLAELEKAAGVSDRGVLARRCVDAEARLAEAQETIAGIPTLCRRYEAKLADLKELLEHADFDRYSDGMLEEEWRERAANVFKGA